MNNTSSEAHDFLRALFAPYSETTYLFCEIRPQHPKPASENVRSWHPLTSGGLQAAVNASLKCARRWNAYVGVLPRIKYGEGKADAIDRTAWVWADIDGGDDGAEAAKALLDRANMPHPNIVVMSGGGLHCYWGLSETVVFEGAEDKRKFSELLQRLVRTIGGTAPGAHADSASTDVPRILRVPGTINHKYPRPVELITLDLDTDRFPLSWWGANLAALPLPPPAKPRPSKPISDDRQMQGLNRWAERGYPEGNRHRDLAGGGKWLVRTVGVPKDIAEELLLKKADASPGRRQIPDEEVRRIIKWA